ncbi:hypothetical protein NEOKW01_0255 [Nematocida sp. AWRm80]|nr:hypothetical protein NEOKW01_0255 [Nematocida sp. AWRm80]
MRASDFFKTSQLKIVHKDHEEYEEEPTEPQEEWNALLSQFIKAPSYTEQCIYTEIHLDAMRKEFISQGLIKQEKIEKKQYLGPVHTLKYTLLAKLSTRIAEAAQSIRDLEDLEEEQREIIRYFLQKEYFKRKEYQLHVHIHNKLFLPLDQIKKGMEASYIECILFTNKREYKGYLTEEKVPQIDTLKTPADLDSLQQAIYAFRNKAINTLILGEYSTKTDRAKVRRVHHPPEQQSKQVILLLSLLKLNIPFEKAQELLSF